MARSDIILRVMYTKVGVEGFVTKYAVSFSSNYNIIFLENIDGKEERLVWREIDGLSVTGILGKEYLNLMYGKI